MPRTELFITLLNTAEMEQSFWGEFKESLFGFLSVAFLQLYSLRQFISTPLVHTLYEHLIPQLRPIPAATKLPFHQLLPLTLSTAQRNFNDQKINPTGQLASGVWIAETKVAFLQKCIHLPLLGVMKASIMGLAKYIHLCGTGWKIFFPPCQWEVTEKGQNKICQLSFFGK